MNTRLKTDFGNLSRDEFEREAQKRVRILYTHAQALRAFLSVIDKFNNKPVTKRIANALTEKVNADAIPASVYYSTDWDKAVLINALTPEGRYDYNDKYGARVTLHGTQGGAFDVEKTRKEIQNRLARLDDDDKELREAVENFDKYAEMTNAVMRTIAEYKKECPRVLRNNRISEIYIPV